MKPRLCGIYAFIHMFTVIDNYIDLVIYYVLDYLLCIISHPTKHIFHLTM